MFYLKHTQPLEVSAYGIGGKARNLFELKQAGLPVPEWVVIPQETLFEICEKKEIYPDDIEIAIQKINNYQISSTVISSIIADLGNPTFVAVRSSAIDEDGSEFSFAGQFESYLYVKANNIAEKIKKVWLSAFSKRVLEYRKNNQLTLKFGIAVIIQRMVNASAAGVAFGINPTNGDRKTQLISAVYGVGEGLVSGELNADNYLVKENKIEYTSAEKTHKLVLDSENGGTLREELSFEEKNTKVLSEKEVLQISETLKKCFFHYGKPQDIEYAFEREKLYLLQARPITNLHKISDINGEFIIWDNSNIIESYPGITTPLTFSFIIKMYEAVYRQFSLMMGINQEEIDENSQVFANMLGILNGRVYYNLLSWYKVLALLPGYSLNAEFMEKMMGVKERFELKNQNTHSRFRERLRVLKMISLMIKNLNALPSMRKKFQKEFDEIMKKYNTINLKERNAHELMALYKEFEQTLLKKWKAPLVNDFFAMIYFGVTQKLTTKYFPNQPNIHNDLLCGAKDIISVEPVHRSLEIATLIAEDSEAKKLFIENVAEVIWQAIQCNQHPKIKNLIDEYIAKFGERCVGELKLETITYKQNPILFIKIIKSYVEQGVVKNNTLKNIDVELRRKAEETVAKKLSGKPFKKIIFSYFLKRARILVSSRENLRYERTRGFGKVRQIFCAMGEHFYAEGIIDNARDVFYLTIDEIFDYIKGTSVNNNLKNLISLRKKEYKQYEKQITAERVRTHGIVYHGNDFSKNGVEKIISGDLKGLGCCPGVVKAKVRVVHSPNEVENLNGDILVTSSTDPGWVTLFPTASAIMVERGSLLSHSAIVSREMGKPCIVGVSNLLEIVKTGDLVEMDGSTGVIKILEKAV